MILKKSYHKKVSSVLFDKKQFDNSEIFGLYFLLTSKNDK